MTFRNGLKSLLHSENPVAAPIDRQPWQLANPNGRGPNVGTGRYICTMVHESPARVAPREISSPDSTV
ncbi:hypothetical protein [Paenirhodobacter populi]|uniref:Uncharacterized protein n=1 Tax=Paenirhodobacter populi TaxID=2306993 RepID=A0A443J6M8_9RHOB|nr:hypothetical protein [Sinirhodobacter populi]RWR05608.1 hypothetical protein D2T32_16495 [Sinirhodobacter populi]RWR16224.1 hypothetical protein D2T30_22200 [Sinirhodobacter populi]